jgi:hypothetical protein
MSGLIGGGFAVAPLEPASSEVAAITIPTARTPPNLNVK